MGPDREDGSAMRPTVEHPWYKKEKEGRGNIPRDYGKFLHVRNLPKLSTSLKEVVVNTYVWFCMY